MFKKVFKKTENESNELLDLIVSKNFTEKKADELLSKGVDIHWMSEDGENYLHMAARKANIEALKWFKDKNLNINQITSSKQTPLFYAVENGSFEIVNFLLENGADVNQTNSFNRTVFQEAVISNKTGLLNCLLHAGVKINNIDSKGRNVVFDSVANGTKNLVDKIGALKGIDINHMDAKGFSVMHQKSVFDNAELAFSLMDNGADPTICDADGKNFLFYCACGGIENEELIDKAIDLGCDINSKNKDHESILMETLKAYRDEDDESKKASILLMAQKLVDNGVEIDAKDHNSQSVIFHAINACDLESLQFLVKQKDRDVNLQDADGNTPLALIALNGDKDYDMLLSLVEYNIDANIADNNGVTIIEKLIDIILHQQNNKTLDREYGELSEDREYLYILKVILENTKVNLHFSNAKSTPIFFDVVLYNNRKLLSLLRDHGININQMDEDGGNIAFRFVDELSNIEDEEKKKVMLENLENIINSGVDINQQNKEGKTAVHHAILFGCENTARIFIESKVNTKIKDFKGRSIVHCCVWKSKVEHFKMISQKYQKVLNESDMFGVLPIHYAAFLGHVELVLKMIEAGSYINSAKDISDKMLEYLKKFVDNLDTLEEQIKDEHEKVNIRLLVDNMKKEFCI